MMKFSIGLALVAGTVLAADWTWNPQDSLWLGSFNWNEGVAWAGGTGDTATFGASSETTVDVNGDVTVSKMSVNDDYAFTNGTITLNGDFVVADDKTATVESTLRQTDTGTSGTRLRKYGKGTLELKGGTNEFYRFAIHQGTVRFNGGEHRITGTTTSAREAEIIVSFAGGQAIVEGGATFKVGAKTSFISNSGMDLLVTNGTFDAWNCTEVLNGFADNNGMVQSARSSITVGDGGVFRAKKIRLGKAANKSDVYAVFRLEKGGTLQATEISMDVGANYKLYGSMVFDGGVWNLTTNGTEGGSARIERFQSGDKNQYGNWKNVKLYVGRGGAHFNSKCGHDSYFYKALDSCDEHDGGVHFNGSNCMYLYSTNSFNGGTWLGGNVFFAPESDRALGAVPTAPTNNVFIESSTCFFHFPGSFFSHQNRNFLLTGMNTMKVGTYSGRTAGIAGTIDCEDTTTWSNKLYVVSDWPGLTCLCPPEGRTNRLGRLMVAGRLQIGSGTTRIMADTVGAVHGDCPLYVTGGNLSSYSDTQGILTITGGVLKVEKNSYVESAHWGQLRVLGGVFDVSAAREWLNGLDGPGRTTVAGTGVLDCRQLRFSQNSQMLNGLPACEVNLQTGGVIRLEQFYIDTNAGQRGVFNMDGGTVVAKKTVANFLGTDHAKWTNILVRACAGGAIFDTTNFSITVKNAIFSGAAVDGGLTKKGTGTLTLANTNSWNGATRVDDGQLVFSHSDGYPGGDLAFTASALARVGAKPLIAVKKLPFRDGAKIRILDAEDFDGAGFGRPKTVLASESEIANVPPVVLVQKDGTEAPPREWRAFLSADRKSLLIGLARGTVFVFR